MKQEKQTVKNLKYNQHNTNTSTIKHVKNIV